MNPVQKNQNKNPKTETALQSFILCVIVHKTNKYQQEL